MNFPSRGQTHRRVHRSPLAGEGCAVLRAIKRRWHYVYLALAKDGSYYCGYALDPRARVAAHNRGKGAKALRGRRPVELVYTRRFADRSAALRFEIRLKRRSAGYKRELSQRWLRQRGRRKAS
jgi:putative endonuclease